MMDVSNIKVSDYESEYYFYNFVLPKIKMYFFLSKEWQDIRPIILERDLYTCQMCGTSHGSLQIDHIKPITVDWENRLNPDNLQVLCADCNRGKSNNYSLALVNLLKVLKPLIKLKERINKLENYLDRPKEDIDETFIWSGFRIIGEMFEDILKEKVCETYKNYDKENKNGN
jgi:5-methylcytosine-specific restriction endonuclease McrA